MKLHPDKPGTQQHIVTAYEAGRIVINGRQLTRSLLLMPDHLDEEWGPVAYDRLALEHLSALTAYSCDVVLIGTGIRQRFPAPALLRPLIEAGRGFEIMDTAAACRTYNIIVAEGRLVLAALIIEQAAG
ncbi:MAG: Mth938-like domain-containing protein [Rhodocyclaceae bacterium]